MASTSFSESLAKEIPLADVSQQEKGSLSNYNPLRLLDSLHSFKAGLGLANPGTYEEVHRDTKNVFPANLLIDGGQFEFIKMLSPNFQISNAFSLGSAQTPSSYNFIGVAADEDSFFQATTDSEFNLNGRLHHTFGRGLTAKGVLQTGLNVAQSVYTLEGDYAGPDNAINIKTVNPSPSTGTGILVASYLQSITKNFALGSEVVVQRPSPEMEDSVMSYVAKYATPQSTFVAQVHDQGVLETSYFHKVSDTAEFAANLQIVAAPGKRDAICTLGAKFEFKQATMRTQIDTTGRVATLLEERIAPPLALLLSADLDHFKGQSRFGLGVRFSI
ncbi:translocase of outer mitochondrial membrane [Entomophthora muscae]|uniref:Translocase of outer mitochondrial membrane n=1 Tax=Entomophthora muscae TaxID=34485 RepID=A0ACC2U3P7_9FUNG|nr:translocase of outer mitochondrial membrane [Entomophthora muscae]